MNKEVEQVAMRLRELRDIYNFKAQEVAEMLGISTNLYESYEQAGVDIPISVVYQLAGIYKVDTTDILSGKSPKLNTISIVRKGEGLKVERYAGYEYENIAYPFMHRTMEPMIVTLKPGGPKPKMVTHGGQEINFCLQGQVMIIYDGNEVILNEGDCVYFNPKYPHGQMAVGEVPAKFLTIINE